MDPDSPSGKMVLKEKTFDCMGPRYQKKFNKLLANPSQERFDVVTLLREATKVFYQRIRVFNKRHWTICLPSLLQLKCQLSNETFWKWKSTKDIQITQNHHEVWGPAWDATGTTYQVWTRWLVWENKISCPLTAICNHQLILNSSSCRTTGTWSLCSLLHTGPSVLLSSGK